MKKILTLLLSLLMILSLVGCNSKEDTPVVQEPEKQEEVVEETKEEPEIVGGYVDVEDGTLTDELKDIFAKALEGLLSATYEPQELVATQVVAGTNYKFLANGTKTTNPITKGTYYIYVNKDLQGNVSLLDIETIEEKQEEAPKQDITQMSFWVVFYDEYDNELQREALKYGTVPSYKGYLPDGFVKWTYKKTGKDVGTLKAITGNTYYQAVCHEVHHSSSDPTPGPTPGPTPPTPVVSATGVNLDKTEINLQVGDTTSLSATVLPENATNKNVTWSSSNVSVATVSNGTVTTIAEGSATITVTTEDGNYTKTCTVTVTSAPTEYTVTFDLNGITGTEPTAQTIEEGGKVTKPADPTDMVHTFAGWYKTKDATTGALSGPWDFDNDTVTESMTLYAKWTRTLLSIYTGSDIPKVTDNTPPDNAWVNGEDGKAFIAFSNNNSVLFLKGTKNLSCGKTENFTKIGDDYVLDYYNGSTFLGKYTLHMTEGIFTSVTYNGAGTVYEVLSGTYTAPAN